MEKWYKIHLLPQSSTCCLQFWLLRTSSWYLLTFHKAPLGIQRYKYAFCTQDSFYLSFFLPLLAFSLSPPSSLSFRLYHIPLSFVFEH